MEIVNDQKLIDAACPDCPAEVTTRADRSVTGESVRVVCVTHAASCPWFGSVCHGTQATLVRAEGILIHRIADDAT